MQASVRDFGQLPTGEAVEEVEIGSAAGARARIITYGAAVRDLVVPVRGSRRSVVLGLNTAADYAAHSPHFGAIAGRYANRINGGRFTLAGRPYQLDLNQAGRHTLHGGATGFGRRLWTRVGHDRASVTLALVSPDGDNGFPGRLQATMTYRMQEPATLAVTLAATCDRPTIVNLAHHSYFNLMGTGDVLGHELEIDAGFYTPVDADKIPTGDIRTVAGTPFDFRRCRPIRRDVDGRHIGYDHNFVLDRPDRGGDGVLRRAASLWAADGALAMETWTTEPGLQFYDGSMLDVRVPGLQGQGYAAHAGLCLEPQRFPDSPNRGHFSPCVLEPGAAYHQQTEYRFIM